jgi:hypothetical protein
MTTVARLALAAICLVSPPAMDAMAHVRTPDFSRLDRNLGSILPEPDNGSRLEHRTEPKDVPAAARQVCGFSRDTSRPPISEVGLHDMRAAGAASEEILSFLDPTASDIVRVAQGEMPDGAACLFYVSFGTEGVARQTFWRFAPDDEPEGWFDEDGRRLGGAALAPPRPGSRLSSPFGPRRYYGRLQGGGIHNGIDYESRVGQPIFAAADGIVELQGTHFEYGLTVKIRHAPQFTTLYAHMSHFAAGSAVGRSVRKGDVIGYVGMTGRSTGAHLHFSAIINGKFVDPAPYLSDDGERTLKPHALVGFRKWQDEVRAVLKQMQDRQRRTPVQDDDWTSRI